MGYQILSETTPETFQDRLVNIETYVKSFQAAGLVGTKFYAGGHVPAVLTGGTDTTPVNGQLWISEIRVGHNALLTGLSYLIGSVGGTDKAIAMLFDANGNLLANSAVAGVTVGTLATFQRLPFTTAYQAAPGLYYVAIQMNGTTARLRTQAAGDHNTGIASQTFGTPAAITPPTTFTAAQGPIAMLY